LTDEAETTVSVVEDYHGEANGSVDDGESDEIEFPVKATAVSVLITYSLDDQRITGAAFPSSVTLVLNDADGSELRREEGQEEGDGSWSFSSDDVQSVGQYVFIIEGEEGTMGYEVDIDVKY